MDDDRYIRTWSPCPHCHVSREGIVDRKDGQYNVTIAADCPRKDECEKELLCEMHVE